jgi:hypothetical protein
MAFDIQNARPFDGGDSSGRHHRPGRTRPKTRCRHIGENRHESRRHSQGDSIPDACRRLPNGKVRTRFLGDLRLVSMLLIISQLVRPEFLVEVEIVAARAQPTEKNISEPEKYDVVMLGSSEVGRYESRHLSYEYYPPSMQAS